MNIKLDPTSEEYKLIMEKIHPFISGMVILRRFSSNLTKSFDPMKAKENPPESCGYTKRFVQINGQFIEFKRDRKVESKVKLADLNSILLAPQMKKVIVQYKKNVSTRPNSSLLISRQKQDEVSEYVQFNLITATDSIDLIAHNYMAFISFNDAIEELLKLKKNKLLDDFIYLSNK